jgi:membrane fusion protein (multidrug efflux system)
MRTIFILAVSFFSILLFSCSSKRKQEAEAKQKTPQRPPARTDVYIVKTKTIIDKLEIPGTIIANEETAIHPEVAGRVTGLYFKEGTYVSKGALLARLNDADLRAQLNKLSVQLKIAQQNENRSSQLLKIQGISQQDYELSLLQVNNIRADMAIINTQIAKTAIRAPFSGKLGLKMVSPGAFVSSQTPITTISQTSQMKIDFTVPEKYTNRIKLGQYINFTIEGSDRAYTARIAATEGSVAEATRSLQVRASVQGDHAGLTPGNFAKVTLNFDPDHNAIVVPTQAIIPQARGKKVYLFQNGQAKFIDVVTGVRDSSFIQITEGLKQGDTVIVTGLLTLKPDAKVSLGKIINNSSRPSTTTEGLKKP